MNKQTPWANAALEISRDYCGADFLERITSRIQAACLEHADKLQAEVEKLKQEDVRRIQHLNRLGSWAQQDPTGPLPDWMGRAIQQWVLEELKAALGTEYKATSWQPSYLKLRDEREALLARVDRLRTALIPLLQKVIAMRDGMKPKRHIIAPDSDTLHWEGYHPSEAAGEPELCAAWTRLIDPVLKALATDTAAAKEAK